MAENRTSVAGTVEPWLRGTLNDLPALHRAVIHALQLADEDLSQWCGELDVAELNMRISGLPSVAFHIRHIARSVDRLLTYAEGNSLSMEQGLALESEETTATDPAAVFAELRAAIESAIVRIQALSGANVETMRTVGRKALPTRLGGLLVHVADHTQRHVGQAITTARVIKARETDSGADLV